jgi:hypothetical protein
MTLGQRFDHVFGGLWWFSDALTLPFGLFAIAEALAVLAGSSSTVEVLAPLGIVLPVAYVALTLLRYGWALRLATGSSLKSVMGAMRVNLSLYWVITFATLRGLTHERIAFLRTPKSAAAPSLRELSAVWVEMLIGLSAGILAVVLIVAAGTAPRSLALTAILVWVAVVSLSAPAIAVANLGQGTGCHTVRDSLGRLSSVGAGCGHYPYIGAQPADLAGEIEPVDDA